MLHLWMTCFRPIFHYRSTKTSSSTTLHLHHSTSAVAVETKRASELRVNAFLFVNSNCPVQFMITTFKMIKFMIKYTINFFKSLIHRPSVSTSGESSDRRPWDPPFDPTRPATPISYPITDIETLESRSYFNSFHFPFNIASVKLPSDSINLPARPRMLVCHDMKGGYTDDLWVQGGSNAEAYAIWHWHLMDVFVYFSHYLVTLPPPCWTNAAHTHGVKVRFHTCCKVLL